nr:PTS transporter subunit EIIC [Faecalicoccus acidiformans]
MASCLMPLIPMLIAASLFKTIAAIIGPDMLGLVNAESDLYVLFSFVGDAGFYFFPIMIGYTASKYFGCNPILGMFLGAIMLHPTFVALAQGEEAFTVYGIPCHVQNYSSSIIPIMLSVFVFSYIERFFNKRIPEALSAVFSPMLAVAVMLPIMLCVLGPIGSIVGEYISIGLIALGNMGGIMTVFAMMLIAALWEYIVMAGMHWLFITTIFMIIADQGMETVVAPSVLLAAFTVGGMCLGATMRLHGKEQKALGISYLIAQMVGGVTEPGLYGIGVRYKRPFIGMMAGGLAAGLFAAIVGLKVYNFLPVASFLALLGFIGPDMMNMVFAIIGAILAFVVSAIVTYLLGVDESLAAEKENQ